MSVGVQYLSIKDSNVTVAGTWYAAQSTNGGNNTGWNFVQVAQVLTGVSATANLGTSIEAGAANVNPLTSGNKYISIRDCVSTVARTAYASTNTGNNVNWSFVATVPTEPIVPIQGIGLVGTPQVYGLGNVDAVGVGAIATVGVVNVAAYANVAVTQVSATTELGSVETNAAANINTIGVRATGAVSSVSITGTAVIPVEGVVGTCELGLITIPIPVQGVSATGSVGNIAVNASARVLPMGVVATGTVKSVRIWSNVDNAVATNWVDIAA